MSKWIIVALVLALLSPAAGLAGPRTGFSGNELTDKSKEKIIRWVCANLDSLYVYEDAARDMGRHIHDRLKAGAYDKLKTVREFTRILASDLRSIKNDQHLRVLVNTNPPPPDEAGESEKQIALQEKIARKKIENFQFKKVEHLPGNVGYLRFDRFEDPRYAGDTAVAAMNFLAGCDALIIDLRYNGGGHTTMEQLLLGYFFDDTVHYNSLHQRGGKLAGQDWTPAYVPGPKLLDTDLYVLVGEKYTFSAAEGFAFALKNQGRAIIIGRQTSGGGHPIKFFYLRELNVELRVPYARGIDPVTGEDFEGVGVTPDIDVPEEDAYDHAYVLALKNLYEKMEGGRKHDLKWKWEYRRALLEPLAVDGSKLRKYAGRFGPVQVKYEDGRLLILEPGVKQYRPMHAITETLFVVDGNEAIRARFELNDQGEAEAVTAMHESGQNRRVPRTAE